MKERPRGSIPPRRLPGRVVQPAEDHRTDRETGALVYPVNSRRSGGLSVGINLFPDHKVCSFDCPYCEVFPFQTTLRFTLGAMEDGLRGLTGQAGVVKDFCFSGNGEPTLSPDFPVALERTAQLRDELAPGASLVLITNGSTLADSGTFDLLAASAAGPMGLDVWLKVDAGTEGWFRAMGRTDLSFATLVEAFRRYAAAAPFTVQTMLCALGGLAPPVEEAAAWESLVLDLVRIGSHASGGAVLRGPRRIHLYGKSRPAPEDPAAETLPVAYLEERAASLRSAFASAGGAPPPLVSVFP